MESVTLELELREGSRKQAAKRLRRAGRVPGILYGQKNEAKAISIDTRELSRMLHSARHGHVILDLKVPGEKGDVKAIFREIQRDPVRQEYLHCDIQRISLKEKIHIQVPVRVVGIADGVKNFGGILDLQLREIEVRCLPTEMPTEIVVDVTHLGIGDSVRVKEVNIPGIEILTEAERSMVTVVPPSILKEATPAAVAEGEAAATEEAVEPELIKKPKKTEEEEESKPESKPKGKGEKG
jgi:large subunit ribosomal protein L25